MLHKRMVWLLTAVACALSLFGGAVSAAEVESGAVYTRGIPCLGQCIKS